MKVNSQLERAQLENVTSLPSAATAGRVAWDTVAGKAFLDDATNWRAFLRNDQLAIIGNSGTAANNVRFHRGANGVLQLVSGADATAEGTLSTAINQISARVENYSTGSLPAFGNLGRIAYDTTTGFPKFDNGSAWKEIVDSSTTQTISGKTLTSATLTDPLLSSSGVFTYVTTPANPSAGTSKLYAKSDGKFYSLDPSGTEQELGTVGSSALATPTTQKFTSGSGTYNKNYTFFITSGSATVGATYTHNSVTYTVYATVSSSTKVVMSGSAAPLSSGTLTKASGTGDASLTFSAYKQPLYLKVRLVGGGGGGSGSSNAAGNGGSGGTGATSSTTFGSSLLTATNGAGATATGGEHAGGAGGTVTVNSPAINVASFAGVQGQGSMVAIATATAERFPGGLGAGTPFSSHSGGAVSSVQTAIANSGAGGAGGGMSGSTDVRTGAGGGSGGFIEAIIPDPSATYSYQVGTGGAAGAAGTAGNAGAAGAAGIVIVEEYYQ